MNADRLRQIHAALQRDFSTESGVSQCQQRQHVHLVYAHAAGQVKARELYPLDHTDFDQRVNSWTWPTTTQYEGCQVVKHVRPYRDFIKARFLWKELAGVQLSQLPANASPPAPTAADGGTLITLTRGASLDPQQANPRVTLTVPAPPQPPPGYPTLHRVCFSTPGAAGQHAELPAGTTQVTLNYPSPESDSELHLIGVMPWFQFELRGPNDARESIDDPWTYLINYDVTPARLYKWRLHEVTTNTDVGSIARYSGHYGIYQLGTNTHADIRSRYADTLSSSRRLVLAAVLSVEGGTSAVGTSDGPKLSWGMNQWTIMPRTSRSGELGQILSYIYDFFPAAFERCFGRYGIGVSFSGRNRNWSPTAYTDVKIFRVPCCTPAGTAGGSVRGGLDAIGRDLQRNTSHANLASAFQIQRVDSTSCAMIYLFHKAGLDEEIQRAQVQWTSYRISYAISHYRLSGSTNLEVLDGFLRSLGSNISNAERLQKANRAVTDATDQGIVYPGLNDVFSETGTEQSWHDWPTRCTQARKEMRGAARAAAPAQQGQARPPVLRQGARGVEVTELQRQLQRAGVFQGNPDGIFGPGTEAAVRQFQNSQPGLQADGIVGPGTWNSLNGARPTP